MIVYEFYCVYNDVICRLMEIICYIVILMGNFVFCVIVFERYIVICYLMRKFN